SAGDMVEVSFERRRYAEVVQGHTNDNDISCFYFRDNFIRVIQNCLLCFGATFGWAKQCLYPYCVQMGYIFFSKVTYYHIAIWVLFFPALYKLLGQYTGITIVAKQTAVNLQKSSHVQIL